MTRRLLVRPRAERDLQSSFEWYESQQQGLGGEFLVEVRERLEAIRSFPESSPVIYRDVRRAIVSRFPYVIFYVVRPTLVSILAVLHQARDPTIWPRRARAAR